MELKATKHHYYCSDSNYYVGNRNGENHGRADFATWADFKSETVFMNDHDYNHCFRFDITEQVDEETGDTIEGKFSLSLYYMLQRKGNFIPVFIEEITEEDMPEIEEYLKDCWRYLESQWREFSKQNAQINKGEK
jgi:hypothetical protein